LDFEVKKMFPSVAPTRWNYLSRIVVSVKHHKTDIENLFISVVENGSEWDSETVFCSWIFNTFERLPL
jgi:hypothetical protein